jgi:hypothetical protein
MESVSWVVPSYSSYVTMMINFTLGPMSFYGYIEYIMPILYLGHSLLSEQICCIIVVKNA